MQLHETVVEDAATGYTRKVWRSKPDPGPRRRMCIVLDAELYLERVGAVEVLGALQAEGSLPQLDWVFVSSLDDEARHRDYTCNGGFAKFIARSVLPAGSGGRNYICGLSLSGLASAHIALSYPRLFAGALCQSGSFWWDNERFAALAQQLGRRRSRLWLSVGDEETEEGVSHPPTGLRQDVSQLAAVERAALALRELGCDVEHRVYAGGHDPARWKEELPEALSWLTA